MDHAQELVSGSARSEKAKPEKAFTTLKRIDKQQILSEAHLYKADEDKLEVISEKSHEILSQTLVLGWILMRWRQDLPLSLPSATQRHEVNLVHPELIGLYFQAQEDCIPDSIEHFRKCIKDFSIGAKRLLLPICAQGHWCLLTLDFTESGIEARYRDSLSKQSHATRGRAEELLHIWDSDMAVPEVCNHAKQSDPTCGWFVLAWMELEFREFLGEGWATTPQPCTYQGKLRTRLVACT